MSNPAALGGSWRRIGSGEDSDALEDQNEDVNEVVNEEVNEEVEENDDEDQGSDKVLVHTSPKIKHIFPCP